MQFIVPSPMKAIDALRQLFPDSSRRTIQNWVRAGRFSVDGEKLMRDDFPLNQGQIVTSDAAVKRLLVPGVPIIYEDRYMIAIDKPVGLLSVPLDEEGYHRHALGLLKKYRETEQIFAVHRIDRETSGVLLFARGKESEDRLKELFENHDLKRQYFAIVEGRIKEDQGIWDAPLKELPSFNVISDPEGKASSTHFKVQRRSSKYSYLILQLETGRKHQIRVHCKLAGHPVVGDTRYGSTENPMKRMGLHSACIELIHPFTGKQMRFFSPLPKPFKVLGGEFTEATSASL